MAFCTQTYCIELHRAAELKHTAWRRLLRHVVPVSPVVFFGRHQPDRVFFFFFQRKVSDIIFYQMLVGFVPFRGDSPMEIFEAVLRANLRFSTHVFCSISPTAKDLLRRMLCKELSRRFLFSSNFFCRIAPVCKTKKGSKIGATLWQELFIELRDKLQCGSSYLIQNLRIVDNQSEYRVSPAPYLVYFLKTTSVKEIHRPEIPSNVYLITPFTDIISGLVPRHTLVDIVGVVVDLIDVKTVNPPHRMTVRLRDNSLSVPFYSGGIINDKDGSQSQSSQSNVVEKFLQNAQVDCYCLTVGTVDEIIIDAPWSYDSCPNCTTTFDPSKGGSACRSCHTSVIDTVPRYKLNVRMKHNEDKGNFLLWDATCIKLFGKTAGECRDELITAGDDIKVFPTCVDEILSKTWAVRFKFRSQLRQSSVLDEQSSKGKRIAVEPESSPPIFVPMSSDFDSDEHAQYQLSTNKHIKAE
ncbi:hypothetical protein JHK85_048602 [Glycine max]|nr:hypothetical protein JHK85_048602 [Glycine max]